MNVRFVDDVIATAIANDGATIDCFHHVSDSPKTGYMVGNERFNESAGNVLRVSKLRPDSLADFVNRRLPIFHAPGSYLGIWRDGDTWVCEPSENILSLEVAMGLAKERNEQSIWDCENKCEIRNPHYVP